LRQLKTNLIFELNEFNAGESMKVSIVLGTRPEIIKMSPVIRSCERLGLELDLDYFVLHTGQHYSYEMDWFFEELELSKADYSLIQVLRFS